MVEPANIFKTKVSRVRISFLEIKNGIERLEILYNSSLLLSILEIALDQVKIMQK